MFVNCLVWRVGLKFNISVSIRLQKGFGRRKGDRVDTYTSEEQKATSAMDVALGMVKG